MFYFTLELIIFKFSYNHFVQNNRLLESNKIITDPAKVYFKYHIILNNIICISIEIIFKRHKFN